MVEEAKTEEKEKEDGTKETVEVSPRTEKYKILKRPLALNDIHPLWNKHPNECTEEEYKEFYRKVFMDYKELRNNFLDIIRDKYLVVVQLART